MSASHRPLAVAAAAVMVAGLIGIATVPVATPAGAVSCTPSASVICITTTSPLPGGTVGSAYNQALASNGGTGTITWSLSAGSTPPGLSVNPSGSISGNPAGAGTFTFTVQATDSNSDTATAPLSLTVARATTTVAPLASPGQSALNQLVTYSAVVGGGSGSVSPTGTVTFTSNPAGSLTNGILCNATVSGGNASCQANDTPQTQGNPSTDTITATYNGDANFQSSSANTTETVNSATTTTTVASVLPTSTTFGQSVAYSATVSGSGGPPTGTVTFFIGATALTGCVNVALAAGSASCNSSAAPGGSDSVTAVYSGTWNTTSSTGFDGSTSAATPLTVGPASDTVTANVNMPNSTFGQSVTYSTTVTSGAGTPGGSVTFNIGATLLCTATLSAGAGSCMSGGAPVGSDTVVADYGGSASFAANSAVTDLTVSSAATTTVISAVPNSTTFGTSVQYNATVSVTSPGVGPASGSVTFTTSSGAITLCTAPISSGTGSCMGTTAPVGSDTISGAYGATTDFNASSGTTTITVAKATPTVTASAVPSTQSLGNSVTYSSNVTSSVQTPTGLVSFAIFGSGAPLALCTATLSSGHASCSSSAATVGASQDVVAVYEGNVNFNSVAATTSVTITRGVTTTAETVAPATVVFGTNVTYSATVSSVGGTPTGSVIFTTGATTLCTIASLSSGSGSCQATNAPLGDDTITASYGGDGNFLPSTDNTKALDVISAAATTTTVTPSPSPAAVNQSVTYSVTVSASGATPDGSVALTTSGGAVTLCTVAALSNGSGSCNASNAPLGSDTITASYGGTLDFGPSTGTALLSVTTDPTTTSVTAVPSTSQFGSSVSYEVTVTNQVSGTPTGTVTVMTGITPLCTILTLSSGSGSCPSSAAPTGNDTITANYGGDTDSALSSGTTALTVNPASTTTTPMVVPGSTSFGTSVDYSATVTSAGGMPTGTVTFSVGAVILCSNVALSTGSAACAATNAPVGNDSVTASYSGDTNFAASTGGASLTVAKATTATDIGVMPTSDTYGTSVTYTATISSGGGTPSGSVVVTTGAVSLCTVTLGGGTGSCTSSAAPAGSDTITASYGGDTNFAPSSNTGALDVSAATSGTVITATPTTTPLGASVSYTATVTSAGGTPTGSVVVTTGATSLCTVNLSAGTGSCSATNAPQGSDGILGTYGGDANFSGSTGTATLNVTKAITVTASGVQPSNTQVGQSVTFSATVTSVATPLVGQPTGSVTFTTSGGVVQLCTALLTSGSAACTSTAAPLGLDSVTASYGGSTAFTASTSAPLPLNVGLSIPSAPNGATASNGATNGDPNGSATAQITGAKVTGNGQGAVVVSSLPTDPQAPAVPQGTGTYVVVTQVGFTGETGSICNLGPGSSLEWWNGTAWVPLPNQTLSTPFGCISFTLSPTSTPSIGGSNPSTIELAVSELQGPESGAGYWLAASDGGIFGFGDVGFFGSTGAIHLNKSIVGMAPTPDRKGYWLVASDGGIFTFGDATFYGSTGAIHLNQPIVAMQVTPDGKGYWLVASDGGIFGFGDAAFYGSTGAIHLNQPIVAMAVTPDGKGYWLVASDGGIFTFGDATFHGSTGAISLNKPIVGMAPTLDGKGYWLVASDGGIFGFGDATFYGSTGAIHLNQPIVAMSATPSGKGYWLVASDGGIFDFGDALFHGSTGAVHLNRPIVTMAEG